MSYKASQVGSGNGPREHPEQPVALKPARRYRSSLAQWQVLHAVVDQGSFAGAAEHLGLTQPAISYSIAKLEDLFTVSLFKQNGRKAHLTEAGRELLERSRLLLDLATELEVFALTASRAGEPQRQDDALDLAGARRGQPHQNYCPIGYNGLL